MRAKIMENHHLFTPNELERAFQDALRDEIDYGPGSLWMMQEKSGQIKYDY